MWQYGRVLIAAAIVCCLPIPCAAIAAEPSPPAPGDVDDELLGDLLGPIDTRNDDTTSTPADGLDFDALNEMLQRELGPAAANESDHPLLGISRKMRSVESRIAGVDAGSKTQAMQGQIVADLDELIRQAQKQCQKACSSSKPKQNSSSRPKPQQPKPPPKKPTEGKPNPKPVRDSNAKPGSGEPTAAESEEMIAVLKQIWGELPESERQQMLELPIEEFLPKYRGMIEQYFRGLAEERTVQREN